MLENLQIGDVVVLGKQYALSQLLSKKILKVLYEKAIVFYQKERFGDNQFAEATHVLIYIGDGLLFEVTSPVAKLTGYLPLCAHIEETGRKYWHLRYKRHQWASNDLIPLNKAVSPMLGQPYAYVDIVPFILEKILGFLPDAYKLVTDIFGGSWKKYMFKLIAGSNNIFLCSTGVAAIYAAMHKENPAFPRPFATSDGNNEYIEMVTPAHFTCWPGDFDVLE